MGLQWSRKGTMRSVRKIRLLLLACPALLGMAFIALTLQAQDAPAGAPQPQAQPASTQPAATQASTQPATRPTTQASDTPPKAAANISLNFKDAQLDAVLDFLSAAAGFVVVKEGKVEGPITVISKQPVSPEMAVTILSAVLKTNGYTAIQEGRVLRILPRDKARKGSIPVFFGSDPDLMSPTDELITQIIQLRNVDATKVLAELKPLMNVESADAAAISSSNSIIITDSSSNIRRVARIIKSLDNKEASSSDIRVRQLQSANAVAAAKLIGDIFKSSGGGGMSQQQIQMMQMQGQPVPPGSAAREGVIPGGAIDQALRGGRVSASADERTNTIIYTGPTETLKVIDGILDQLDANETAGSNEIRVFNLINAQAEETAKLITSIFKGEEDNNRGYDDYFWGGSRRNSGDQALKVKVEASFDERTNSVIVTAPASTLKVIEGLISKLDTDDQTRADLKVFQLKNAEAFSVSILLEDIFKPKDTESDNDFPRWFYYGSGGNNNKKAPKMTAVSDDRTNTVIVTAPTEMLKAIEEVINQLDTNPVSEEAMFIVHLRNAQSDNLEIVLNTLFGNINPPQNQDGQSEDEQRQQQFRDSRQNRDRSSGSNNNSSRNTSSRNNNRSGRRNNQMTPGLTRAVTELSGKVFVVADVDTNSLLVTTASRYEQQVRQIVKELDRPVPQVLIKVLLAEVTHNDDVDYGVDFSVLNRRPSGLGQVGGTNFGNATATGGLVVSVLETNVNATLRAIQSAGKLDVLSRPYILASDNQLAHIQVGQEIAQITTSTTGENGPNNSFTYKEIGIILDVTPHINPDGQVILDVAPEISTLSEQSITISPGVESPILNKRSAVSRVEVQSGQTVVIGGLMQDRKTTTVDKVPLLGDIPGIGEIFKRTRKSKVKTELLIFLTPHVAENTHGLEEMSTDELQGTKLTPNAVTPETFQDHMKGLRRGSMPLTRPSDLDSDGYVPIRAPESTKGHPATIPSAPEFETPTTRPAATGQQ
jgi:type II secretion system protein D